MNIEIVAYGLVLIAAVLLSFPAVERAVSRHIVPISIGVFFILSIAIRFSTPRADFRNYFRYLSEPLAFRPFEVREPIIWYGSRAINGLTQNPSITYVILDMLAFTLVVAAFRRMKLPVYAFLAVMAFFPFFLGMQNIYRQWVATCFLLYAIANTDRGMLRPAVAFVLAIATHNVSAIFAGLLVPALPPRWRTLAMIACFILMPIAIYFGGTTKFENATGLDLHYVYVAVVALISAASIAPHWRQKGRVLWQDALPYVYMLYLVAVSSIVLTPAPAERVGLSCFLLLYPSIARLPDVLRGWQIPTARIAIALGGFIPVLLVGARQFLY